MYNPGYLRPILTDAGRMAATDAKDAGIKLDLTHIVIGVGKYGPNGSETEMVAPVSGPIPLTAGDRPTPSQLRLAAIWMQDVGTYHITEVGFYAGDVLAYVWSTEDGHVAAVKTDGVPYVMFVDIGLVNDFEAVVEVVVDPAQSVAIAALVTHESARDAHPQYLRRDIFPSEMRMMWGLPEQSEDPNNVVIRLPDEVELPHYAPGQRFTWRAAHTNTGPMTMNVDGLGALPLKKAGVRDLEPADIEVGCAYDFYFDGDKFQLAVGTSNIGHADSASRLRTPRAINGVLFDGTQNIVIKDDTKEPIIQPGAAGTFYGGDKTWQDFGQAVRGVALDGLALGSGPLAAADTLLVAMGKVQGQINAMQAAKAPLASPALTGEPTAPTAPVNDNSQRIANTAFVNQLFAALIGQAPEALNSVYELAAALGNDPNFATTVFDELGKKLDATATAVAAAKLATARTLKVGNTGKAFDGTGNVTWTLAEIGAQAALGFTPVRQGGGAGQLTNTVHIGWGNTAGLLLQVDSTDFANNWPISISKNAATATKLATARTIGGVAFDGTANINLPGVNTAGNQNTSGNAGSATKLATARTLTIGSSAKAFDGTGNVSWSLAEIGAAALNHTHAYLPLTGGAITGNIVVGGANRNCSLIGTYDASKTQQIWAMGSGYLSDATGATFGSLYGLAYKHTNNATGGTMAGGHQVVWCAAGTPKGAIGDNIWTAGQFIGNGASLTNLNAANLASGIVPAARLSGTYAINISGSAASCTGNAGSATKLATPRALTIGSTAKNFDGSGNVAWSLAEIGAAAAAHTHPYLPLTGGTLTGNVTAPSVSTSNWFRSTGNTGWYSDTHGGGIMMQDTTWVRVHGSKSFYVSNQIAATGDITAFYSDARLKENIRGIDNALDAVLSWRGVRYNANELAESFGYDRDKQQVGLLAQDVEKTAPELVVPAPFDIDGETGGSLTGENYKTLKYDRAVPYLVEALREVSERLETAMKRIEQLERAV